jgi:hypothetical protein
VIGVGNDDRLNARACPGVAHPVLYELAPFSAGVRRAGRDGDVDGYPWTPVSYAESVGWVNAGYLARQFGEADPAVAARAGQIVWALRDQDWEMLASSVHPTKGVRFSPYAYVRVGEGDGADLAFGADELIGLIADQTVYRWGVFDGSGEPIDMTFRDYYARFVYDADFGWAYAVGYGTTVGAGNTINNVAEVYSEAQIIEYHLPGSDPQFAGMDWRSLRLVMERVGETWYLVGVVHDEWTI